MSVIFGCSVVVEIYGILLCGINGINGNIACCKRITFPNARISRFARDVGFGYVFVFDGISQGIDYPVICFKNDGIGNRRIYGINRNVTRCQCILFPYARITYFIGYRGFGYIFVFYGISLNGNGFAVRLKRNGKFVDTPFCGQFRRFVVVNPNCIGSNQSAAVVPARKVIFHLFGRRQIAYRLVVGNGYIVLSISACCSVVIEIYGILLCGINGINGNIACCKRIAFPNARISCFGGYGRFGYICILRRISLSIDCFSVRFESYRISFGLRIGIVLLFFLHRNLAGSS